MSKKSKQPGYKDAELMLRLYELRREPVMRQSRDAITFGFWPHAWEELAAVMSFEHPGNAAFRQVTSYWEMVFAIAHADIAHADFLVENSGEGILLYTKVQPHLGRLRAEFSPTAFQHMEWAATKTKTGRAAVERLRKRFADKLGGAPAPG